MAKLSYDYEVLMMSEAVHLFSLGAKENRPLPLTWSTQPPPYTLGYSAVKYCVEALNKTKFFFHGRADSWGWEIHSGFQAAINNYKNRGAIEVDYVEVPMGAPDFTPNILKAMASGAEVLVCAQFGGDSVNILKQAYSLGLSQKMTIFIASMTNAVALGVPPEALEGVYACHYFYYDFRDYNPELYDKYAKEFVETFWRRYGYPPDSYVTAAYIAFKELFRAVQEAKSFDWREVVRILIRDDPNFVSIKGPGKWRPIGDIVFDEIAWFIVKGKKPAERTGTYDFFKVVGSIGGPTVALPYSLWGYPTSETEIRALWGY
jgi:branched-chain amino acid transport system substrate-binding protein